MTNNSVKTSTQATLHKSKTDWLPASLLVAIVTIIHLPIVLRMRFSSDYLIHIGLAEKMLKSHAIVTPHFLYQMMTILVHKIFLPDPDRILLAGVGAVLFCYAFTAGILFVMLRKTGNIPAAAAAVIAASLMLAGPFAPLAPLDGHLYFGYLAPNVFHNPTILTLKPFALLLFYLSWKIFPAGSNSSSSRLIAVCATVTMLSALAKPSYIICFLPALALLVLGNLLVHEKPDGKLLFIGFIAPAAIVLIAQFYLTYSSAQTSLYKGESGIVLAPFLVMSALSKWLPAKLLLSTLFPCAVLFCYFRAAIRDRQLVFAWLTFLIGAFYTYFLAESGPRMLQGNFIWSGQICLFILFVATALFFAREQAQGKVCPGLFSTWRALLCSAIYCLHVVSGIIFYFAEYRHTQTYW